MSSERLAARLLATFLSELEEQLERLNSELIGLESEPSDAARLASVFRIMHTLKGAASAANVPLISRVCHNLESLLAEARIGSIQLGAEEFSLLFAAADALSDARERLRRSADLGESPLMELASRLKGNRNVSWKPPPNPHSASDSQPEVSPDREDGVTPGDSAAETQGRVEPGEDSLVRVDAAKVDDLFSLAGQLLIVTESVAERSSEAETLFEDAHRWGGEWASSIRAVRRRLGNIAEGGRILRLLDGLEAGLGAIVQSSARLATGTRETARALARESADLVQGVRRLSLRPFSNACLALPRVVRDTTVGCGKEVELQVTGGEVEADRAILDLLHDVLIQLVRNAVDHGIEPAEERQAAGKPRVGTVRINAELMGSRLVVTVGDDGRGLDLDSIRRQLEARGLPVPSTDEEVARVVLRPGFSTREEATATSGRGVGLDIVVDRIERIGGSVRLRWEERAGTEFILECSPSLATTHALLVRVGRQFIAIPSAQVEHLVTRGKDEIRRVEGRAVILTDRGPVPLISLARLLSAALDDRRLDGDLQIVCLLVGDRRLALVVDEFLAADEMVVRSLPPDTSVPLVAGASVLPSGRIALVLNPSVAVTAGLASDALEPVIQAPVSPVSPRRILVVDDSITTRTLEQNILEASGFEVTTAVDGQEAWAIVQQTSIDLVVSDVEMPRMDGFALCEAIRRTDRLATMPIILVTALDQPEHRSRGMKAGADAYLPKTSFDHRDLLDTIRQLLDLT